MDKRQRSNLNKEKHISTGNDSGSNYWCKEKSGREKYADDFRKPSLNKHKELLYMANEVSRLVRGKEIKSVKKLADDEFYIGIFEKEFNEIDFHDLKGAQSLEQKAENLQIMIDFLGNAVYEMDLSHIEPSEILDRNYDHIHRFVKLLYEWSVTQAGVPSLKPLKKIISMGNSGTMPTVDTYENIKNQTDDNDEIINFYHKRRPDLAIETGPQGTSKFRILSNDKCENNEIFQNIAKTSETPTIRSSLTASANTTILGGAVDHEEKAHH